MGMIYKPTYRDKKTGEKRQSAKYWLKYYIEGKPIQEPSGMTKKTEALRLLKIREGKAANGEPIIRRMNRVKFNELGELVVRDYETNGRATTVEVKRRLRLHLLPYFGGRNALEITTVDIDKFIEKRQKDKTPKDKPPTNAEINRELAIIKRGFNLALQKRLLTSTPYIPKLKENNVRKGFYQEELIEAAKAHLSDNLSEAHADVVRDLVTFWSLTGWRKSEGQSLLWANVDFKAETVYLEDSKNDEPRLFPFDEVEELRELLERRRAYTDDIQRKQGEIIPWVFHRDGNQVRECKRSWGTACAKVGMPERIIHDFRRTAVRNLDEAGVSETLAMQMTGHKTNSIYKRYRIVRNADLRRAGHLLQRSRLKSRLKSGEIEQIQPFGKTVSSL